MTVAAPYSDGVVCAPRAGTLYDVLELILDRGMVIDIFVRVSLVGIEVLKIDARVVVASVDTYLRFAEACHRLDLEHDPDTVSVPELFGADSRGMAKSVGRKAGKKAVSSVGEKAKKAIGVDEDDEGDEDEARTPSRRPSTSKTASSKSTSAKPSRPAGRPRRTEKSKA